MCGEDRSPARLGDEENAPDKVRKIGGQDNVKRSLRQIRHFNCLSLIFLSSEKPLLTERKGQQSGKANRYFITPMRFLLTTNSSIQSFWAWGNNPGPK